MTQDNNLYCHCEYKPKVRVPLRIWLH